jgi:hypothetical protein
MFAAFSTHRLFILLKILLGVFQCGAGLQIRHHLESDPGYLSR